MEERESWYCVQGFYLETLDSHVFMAAKDCKIPLSRASRIYCVETLYIRKYNSNFLTTFLF